MPKRKFEEGESREDRWLRKMQFYEEKLLKKKRLSHSADVPENSNHQGLPIHDEQIEEHLESNETLVSDPNSCSYVEHTTELADIDEMSVMSETTAGTSSIFYQCNETERNDATEDFDPTLLQELGDEETEPVEYGEELQTDVAARFQKILLEGLKKETKVELLKKYPFPKNVPLAKGPTLNPEIDAILAESCRLRDKRLLTKQDQIGKALSALGKGLSSLLRKSPDIPEIIRTLSDAGKLIADSHYVETDTRRSVIVPLIDKSLSEPFKDRKRDSFLFGDKLGDLVKDSRVIKKTGLLIQPSTSRGPYLNGKSPSSRSVRLQRGNQAHPYRAGGQKVMATAAYQYSNRQRTCPPASQQTRRRPPPPPQTRRPQIAPPPPPPRQSNARRA